MATEANEDAGNNVSAKFLVEYDAPTGTGATSIVTAEWCDAETEERISSVEAVLAPMSKADLDSVARLVRSTHELTKQQVRHENAAMTHNLRLTIIDLKERLAEIEKHTRFEEESVVGLRYVYDRAVADLRAMRIALEEERRSRQAAERRLADLGLTFQRVIVSVHQDEATLSDNDDGNFIMTKSPTVAVEVARKVANG